MNLGDTATQAASLLNGERNATYGPPNETYKRASEAFFALTGIAISTAQVMLLMALVKLSREQYFHKPDNLIDAAAYLDMMNYTIENGKDG